MADDTSNPAPDIGDVPPPPPVGDAIALVSVAADQMPPRYLDAGHTSVAVCFLQNNGQHTNRAVSVGGSDLASELFTQWLAEDATRKVTPFADAPTLQKLKDGYCAQVDADAERCRLQFVTAGSAQAGVYLAKYEEAVEMLSDDNPTMAKYPLLAASVGVDGETLGEVAITVRGIQHQWRMVAGHIEGIRLRSKRDIQLAATTAQVQAIKNGIVWPKA